MGPAEVWRLVEAGGGAAEMTVRELRDAFGVTRLTARARQTIADELEALGLHLEPPLDGLGLAARVRVSDTFEREPRPEPEPEPDPEPEPVPDPEPEAAPSVPAVATRRPGPRLGRAVVPAIVAAALLMAGVASAIVRSGGDGPPPVPPEAAAATVRSQVGAVGQPVAEGVLLTQYRMATRLGQQGRYLEARAAMASLGTFRNAPAAARSYSVRAAQAMLAEARRIRTTRPGRARALVRDAARIAPGLSSLPRVRALVDGEV